MATTGQQPNPAQFAAIQNGANSNSLVNQLFSINPLTSQSTANSASTPSTITKSPNVQAATAAVKSPNAPATNPVPASVPTTPQNAPTGQPNQTVAPGPGTAGYTYSNGILTSVGGQPTGAGQSANTYAPGTPQNGGDITQNNATPNSQNGVQVGGPGYVAPTTSQTTFTTPNGAVVDANGNIITPAPQPNTTLQSSVNTLGGLTSPSQATNLANNNAENALDTYNQLVNESTEIGLQGAQGDTGLISGGLTSPVAQGREGAINAQVSNAQQQLATKAAAAANVYNTSINAAQTGNAQQISAASSAGQLASPGNAYIQQAPASTLVGANGQPISQTDASGSNVSALTGQPITSTGNPQADAAVTAALQLIKNGSGYTNAVNAMNLNLYGTKALAALQSGLPQGFNINASDATAGAQASNINTLGTATASGEASVLGSIPALDAASTAAAGISNTITTYLQNNPQLNPSVFSNANAALQFLNGQVSNPEYQTLSNYLQEYINTLTPILGVGGDSTNLKTQIASSFVNAAANGSSISSVLNNINSLASQKISNLKSGATGGGVVNSNNNPLGI